MKSRRCKHWLSSILASLLCVGSVQAGSFLFDFNEDPATSGLMTITGAGSWYSYDGVGYATNYMDGFLKITYGTGQSTRIIFSDFDAGSVVQGFTFECDLRIGNGSDTPADGFSVNYCRADDPVLTGGAFARGQNCEANLPEEGTQTGIGIGFDAYQSGGTAGALCDVEDQSIGIDVPAVTVRVDGVLVRQFPCPTRHGVCNDATSIQTGPRSGDGTTTGLCWARLKVQLASDGKLSVWWKGTQILTDYQTSYYPSAGRLVFAGRTGDLWQHQDVDNISITTVAAAVAQVGLASGLADGFVISITDSGQSIVDPSTANAIAKLDGVAVAPLTAVKTASTTTFTYHGFPTLLTPGSAHEVEFSCVDGFSNPISATRPFTVPSYVSIPASDAVTGVDTSKVGFRLRPWQSGSQPNRIYWTEEQFLGLHGENSADLSQATDGGYIPYTGLMNFNLDVSGQAGSFQSGGGYPDSPMPGIPGANLLTGSTALEALMFLKFPAAGLYTLVVNSDDGFLVTEGKNPKDRFALRLGSFDGGKGASDESFTVAVMGAGIYPVRLIWENGNGELPGNGANLEFFTVADGVKTLINDPNPANTTGIAAYYAGPALPAYVSHLYPPPGFTGVRADKLVAQITDGSTTVTSGSVKLLVDGEEVGTAVSKNETVSTVTAVFTPATMMAPGTRAASLVWSDSGGTVRSNSWTFGVANWVMLNGGLSAPLSTADTTAPGFTVQVAQIDPDIARPGASDGMANQVDSANALLGGLYFPWYGTNTVNTNTYPAPLRDNIWAWDSAMDFNMVTSPGEFTYDQALPGIPGVTGRGDNFAAWFNGYVGFTNAGYYRMAISSDDGFRVSQGTGITRQVLRLKGSGVDRDVAAVVASTNNTTFGGSLPVVPISGPVEYFPANSPAVGTGVNLTGKIAAINNIDWPDRAYVHWAQTNGAIGVILINDQQWGLPYLLGGNNPDVPIHIPVVCVNGFGGEEQTYATNANLVATIGADAQLQIGIADYGKGMGWIEFGFVVPQPGLYPIHVLFEQGGGGAGLEWVTTYSDTLAWDDVRRVLVQDTMTEGSLMAYRALTVQPTPTINVVKETGVWKIYFTGSLLSSATVNGTYAPVAGATSPYTIPTGPAAAQFYRSSM